MRNWEEFRKAEPTLQRIEERYAKLLRFEQKYPQGQAHVHGFTSEDLMEARNAMLSSIKVEARSLNGKIYYWLYPFYRGNFLKLVAALGSCGLMDKQKDDPESRNAFYKFFKTVPMEEKLHLGKRLNQPELTEKAMAIQQKIQQKKRAVKDHMDKYHGN
ncbi:hypothetical protein [Pontibacter sp. G13]|uniref:hypothetical protein n=1 Tax=Pontibacter sp. G13 TaxID=3074898 RepID=UPI00288C14AC|nr:hypothetical protein [Pontibacter sp. G13]WNJ19963.1 hypothetical protein RJD25_05725 [Pontibacter sp. G13]